MADTNRVLSSLPKPKRNASKEMKMKQTNKQKTLKPSRTKRMREKITAVERCQPHGLEDG